MIELAEKILKKSVRALAQVPAQLPGIGSGAQGAQPGGLPHDIRPLLPYVPTWADRAPWIALVLALALGLIAAFIWWKRSRKPPPPPPSDPWAELQKTVRGVVIEPPFLPASQREVFYRLSLLLREGIERRTEIRATDSTLSEMRQALRKKLPFKVADVEEILAFLERSDLVKFAEQPATIEEASAARANVAAWCGRLQPAPDPLGDEQAAITRDILATAPPAGGRAP